MTRPTTTAKANPTTAKAAPKTAPKAAPKAAPVKAAPVTAAPQESTGLDLAGLADGAVTVKALPKATRDTSGTAKLAQLVTRSFTENKVFELPAVAVPAGGDPAKVTATLVAAVRRAAAMADLGVSVRSTTTENGVVVSLAGKAKREKNA